MSGIKKTIDTRGYTSLGAIFFKRLGIMADVIWYRNVPILWQSSKLLEFWPTDSDSLERKLNAICRLAIYVLVAIAAYERKPDKLYFIPIVLLISIVIYQFTKEPEPRVVPVARPSVNDPFMNNIPKGVKKPVYFQDTPEAERTRMLVDKANEGGNMYKDLNDVYSEEITKRNMVSEPEDDYQGFLDFLAEGYVPRQEEPGNYEPFTDLRRQTRI